MRTLLIIALLLMFGSSLRAAETQWQPDDAVLHDGRVKPVDTLARQTVRFVTGKERFDGVDALATLQSWQNDPSAAEERALLHVPNLELRQQVAQGRQWVAPGALRANETFVKQTDAWMKQQADAEAREEAFSLSRLDQASVDLRHRLMVFDAARSGRLIMPAKEADASLMQLEVAYNRIHPFRWTWIAYAVATIGLIAAAMSRSKGVGVIANGLLVLAIVVNAVAFAWRCRITGWAPVTNMYETVVWVSMMAAVFAGAMGWIYRNRTIAIAGAVTAVIGGIIADVMPPSLGDEIASLAPVLRSNYWLTIHVLTIVSSYAALALACVLGNVWLARAVIRRGDRATPASSLQMVYRSIQVGVLLLAAGTILGGLWADVSWGRFWGWDPKEVWALIALLTYLALLHGRYAGWVGPFGLAAGSVLCFSTVLMSWYGVNFVLGVGLHSYGFGTGGQAYVGTYVLLQIVYVAVARVRYQATNRSTPETRTDGECGVMSVT